MRFRAYQISGGEPTYTGGSGDPWKPTFRLDDGSNGNGDLATLLTNAAGNVYCRAIDDDLSTTVFEDTTPSLSADNLTVECSIDIDFALLADGSFDVPGRFQVVVEVVKSGDSTYFFGPVYYVLNPDLPNLP